MTQSDDKMAARGTLWSIIPRDGTGHIIRRKKHFSLYFRLNGFLTLTSVVLEAGERKGKCGRSGRLRGGVALGSCISQEGLRWRPGAEMDSCAPARSRPRAGGPS